MGLQQSGINIVAAVENDKWAADTYEFNHPNVELVRSNIMDLTEQDWSQYKDRIDLIVGGPPCQGFSVSGKRQKGLRLESTELIAEFMKVVEIIKPRYFLMENVVGFKSGRMWSGRHALDYVIEESARLGYQTDHTILQAADFGVPSIRSRVFVIGSINGEKKVCLNMEPTHSEHAKEGTRRWISCLSAISDLPQIEAREGIDGKQAYTMQPLNEYQELMRKSSQFVWNHEAMKHTNRLIDRFKVIEQGKSSYQTFDGKSQVTIYKSNNQRLVSDEPSKCITANFQSNYIHPILHRNLTSREAARLMSFPDIFIFKGKRTLPSSGVLRKTGREDQDYLSQYNQIGNAVPPLLAQAIGRHILINVD